MSYKEGIQIGNALMGIGGALSETMRKQDEAKVKAEERELEKQSDIDAAKALKDPEHLSSVPEDRQLAVLTKIAKVKADEYRASKEGIELEGLRRKNNYEKVRETNMVAQNLYANGDYNSAAEKLSEGYGYLNDHWGAKIEKTTDAGTPGNVTLKHQFTGETKKFPITKKGVGEALGYFGKFGDPKIYDALEQRNKAFVQQYNIEAADKAEVVFDQNNKKVGQLVRYINKDQDGNYDLDKGPQAFLFAKGKLQQMDELPEGWTTEKAAKSEADIAKAGFQKKQAQLGGQALGTPDYAHAFQTEGGETVAPVIGGGYGKVNPSMAKREKPHILGTTTDEEGNVQALVQEDPYSSKVTASKTGIKAAKKEGESVVNVRIGNSDKTRQMPEKTVRKNLDEAKKSLEAVKDKSGNPFTLPSLDELDSASQGDKETVLTKIERISKDTTNQTPTVRSAARNALNYLEALGITTGETSSAAGKKTKSSWKDYATGTGSQKVRQPIIMP